MPTYAFRCASGDHFDAHYPIADVPAHATCPSCNAPAQRVLTAPHLSRAGSSTYGLIERSERSAHEPAVVHGRPGGAPRTAGGGVTTNPLHQKLPRP